MGGRNAGDLGSGYCAANYSGPLCEVCSSSEQYYDKGERLCKDCELSFRTDSNEEHEASNCEFDVRRSLLAGPDISAGVVRILVVFFLAIILILLATWIFLRVLRDNAVVLLRTRDLRHAAMFLQRVRLSENQMKPKFLTMRKPILSTCLYQVRSIGLVACFKILFSFTQIVGLIPIVYRLDLPTQYRKDRRLSPEQAPSRCVTLDGFRIGSTWDNFNLLEPLDVNHALPCNISPENSLMILGTWPLGLITL